MNILLYVMTILMLLSLLTYSRLDIFRKSSVIQKQFERSLQTTQQSFFSEKAQALYEMISVNEGKGKSTPPINATRRLSWSSLVKPIASDLDNRKQNQILNLSKKLILLLFHNQPFFEEAMQQNPHIIDDLFKAIPLAVQNLPSDLKISKTTDLANLNLNDPLLNDFFYHLLKGYSRPSSQIKHSEIKQIESESKKTEGEVLAQQEEGEHHSQPGSVSLLDFITLDAKLQIRLYLTPEVILQAIYGDEAFIEHIVKERALIYLRMRRDESYTKEQATSEFTSLLKGRLPAEEETLMNFQVTKVDPRKG